MSDHGPSSETHAPGGHDDHGTHAAHGGSLRTYLSVFVTLCVLTSASFMTTTDLWRSHFSPHTSWAFMMAISCSKALLVIMFFMHLKYEANWKYVLTIPAAFMSIFLTLMLVPDVGRRFWSYSDDRLKFCAELPEKSPAPHHPAPEENK